MRAILIASLLLASCLPITPPTPIPGAGCVEACETMERLQCVGFEGSTAPDGTRASCADACRQLEAEGVVSLNTECVAGAESCAQVEACSVPP